MLNNSKTNQYFDLKFGEDVKKHLHFTPFLVDFQNSNLEGHRSQKTICKFKFTLPPYGQKIFTVVIQQSADFNQLIEQYDLIFSFCVCEHNLLFTLRLIFCQNIVYTHFYTIICDNWSGISIVKVISILFPLYYSIFLG